MKTNTTHLMLLGTMLLAACGGGDDSTADPADTGMSEDTDMTDTDMTDTDMTDTDMTDTDMTDTDMTDTDPGVETLELELSNRSGAGPLPSPLAPGVVIVHSPAVRLFDDGMPDSVGLEALAEDGDPSDVIAHFEGMEGVYLVLATDPIPPGASITVPLGELPADARVNYASMFGQSNDAFVAFDPEGFPVFDDAGDAMIGDLSANVALWDAGTETDETLGQGLTQGPRQSGPDTGADEGVVHLYETNTQALPLARDIVSVTVTEASGAYTITVEDRADGPIRTPLAPVFWATHTSDWQLFAEGEAVSAGLELLAEDGAPTGLLDEVDGVAEIGVYGAAATTASHPDEAGPAMPGEAFSFTFTPDVMTPYLSFAAMVVESNDAFVALPPMGVSLYDDAGMMLSAEDLAYAIGEAIALWDAGTELNQVPGAGDAQPLRGAMVGDPDPIVGARRYVDTTNDLMAGGDGLVELEVTDGIGGVLEIRVTNISAETGSARVFTPVVWALHDADVAFVTPGEPAPEGVERLAEDGDGSAWLAALEGETGVASAGLQAMVEAGEAGPLTPGASYVWTIEPAGAGALSLASMLAPSNDTFWTSTIVLTEDMSAEDVAAALQEGVTFWDAGTELNQPGAIGADQAPWQAAPNTGMPDGTGLVRPYDAGFAPMGSSVLGVALNVAE